MLSLFIGLMFTREYYIFKLFVKFSMTVVSVFPLDKLIKMKTNRES